MADEIDMQNQIEERIHKKKNDETFIRCPECKSDSVTLLTGTPKRYQCRDCKHAWG